VCVAPLLLRPGHKEAVRVAKRLFVDLFAGCGGLSLGLEFAGFEPIAFSEISTEAKDTYLLNRPQFPKLKDNYFRDAKELTKKKESAALLERHGLKKGELDLVCGGPPCQGFSRYGHRRTFTALEKQDIATNHLYVDMAKIVDNLQPKMFLFENVQGLVNARWKGDEASEPGEVFDDVITRFKEETNNGYELSWRLTRACEFGVPQNRPRVIMVGINNDVFKELPEKYREKNNGPRKQTTMFPANQNASEYKAAWFKERYPQITNFPAMRRDPQDISTILGDLVDDDYLQFHAGQMGDLKTPDKRKTHLNEPATYTRLTQKVKNHNFYFRFVPHKIWEKWAKLKKKEKLTEGETAALKLVQSLEEKGYEMLPPKTAEEDKHFRNARKIWRLDQDVPVANHVHSLHTRHTVERFEKIVKGGYMNAKAAGVAQENKFSQRRLPETWNGKDPNITITSMPDDFVHYEQPRSLTVRECARLQTFPDWYIFDGKRTTGGRRRAGDYDATNDNGEIDPAQLTREVPQYTQVGNAVPVWMARAIGRHLSKILSEKKSSKQKTS